MKDCWLRGIPGRIFFQPRKVASEFYCKSLFLSTMHSSAKTFVCSTRYIVNFCRLSPASENARNRNQKWMEKLFQYSAASLWGRWGRCDTPGRRGAHFWQPLQIKTNFIIIFFLYINNLYTANFQLVLDPSNLFRK